MIKTPSYSEYVIDKNRVECRKAVNQPKLLLHIQTEGTVRNLGRDLEPSKELTYIGSSPGKSIT